MMRTGIFFALAMALLAGLWALLRPLPADKPADSPTESAAPAPSAEHAQPYAVTNNVKRFNLQLGEQADPVLLRVQAGDAVELSVTSPEDDELHVHGYDMNLTLRAGKPGKLYFFAEHAGRFEIELHRKHAALGVLEVSPR